MLNFLSVEFGLNPSDEDIQMVQVQFDPFHFMVNFYADPRIYIKELNQFSGGYSFSLISLFQFATILPTINHVLFFLTIMLGVLINKNP